MQGLRIGSVAGEGVGSVESAGGRAVPSRAVVVIRDVLIKVFACVAQVGLRCYSSIIAERYAVSIVIMDIGNAGGVQYLPCRAVPIVEQVFGSVISLCLFNYISVGDIGCVGGAMILPQCFLQLRGRCIKAL